MSEQRKITLAAGILSLATLISRFAGLARDMVIATLFGAGLGSDAFFMAFTIPNLLRRFFAEGSLTAAFVPTFSQVREQQGEQAAQRVMVLCWSLLATVMVVVTMLGIVLAPGLVQMIAHGFGEIAGKLELTVSLTRIMFPYIFFVSLLALLTGVLNVYGHYFVPAISPLVLNLAMISSALLLHHRFVMPIEALAWGVITGGVLQLTMTLPVLRRYGLRLGWQWNWCDSTVRRIILLMVPGIAGVAIYQINVVVTRLLSSFLEQGSVSYLYYGQRLFEFPQGIFIVSLAQAVLPTMSRQAAAGEVDEVKRSLRYALSLIVLVTLPAGVGLIVCAEPIFSQLFMQGAFGFADVQQTALALAAYAPGLVFVGISRVIVPTFYALQDTRTPVWISFWTLLANVAFGLLLMGPFQHIGLAAALTLSSVVNSVILLVMLRRKIGRLGLKALWVTTLKALLACAVMAVVVDRVLLLGEWSAGLTPVNAMILSGSIVGGVASYLLVGRLVKIAELKELQVIVQRKLRRG
ncbi:murein biosynthesis integral membrane protein MurJ [Desulfuromonas acetoxidans]|uniref:murein biosynthesis integral membrane protein MurJ n=1 Tax=Desulfuromonas acetoxidans TaxID=891 RepID=UPI00292D08A7|nr:murein biosynthesis integral membrane protein MurJ [Desulfuromonas acetoxidans]